MHLFSFKKLSILVLALSIAACSTTGQKGGKSADGLYSKGLGNNVGYISEDRFHHASTEAPANQTYYFAYDSSTIKPEYAASLTAQAAYLVDHPGARVLIEGHTDERGSREYNIGLGERRANAVARFLKAEGVNSNQVRTLSYGKERPVKTGSNQEAYAENRRANIIYENVG